MSCEKWLDPFDMPPPEKVVSGRLETRDAGKNCDTCSLRIREMSYMWCEKYVDAPPENCCPDWYRVYKVSHILSAEEHAKLLAHAGKFGSDVPTLLRGIVEDFVKGLPEPPKNS